MGVKLIQAKNKISWETTEYNLSFPPVNFRKELSRLYGILVPPPRYGITTHDFSDYHLPDIFYSQQWIEKQQKIANYGWKSGKLRRENDWKSLKFGRKIAENRPIVDTHGFGVWSFSRLAWGAWHMPYESGIL